MLEFARKKINFTCVKVNDSCNAMIKIMTESYAAGGMNLNITDLSNACKNKSQAEVTKDFVTAATSYIISVSGGADGKPGKGGAGAAKKIVRKNKPLWDSTKIAVGQWLS